jgi:hypothetical protein
MIQWSVASGVWGVMNASVSDRPETARRKRTNLVTLM